MRTKLKLLFASYTKHLERQPTPEQYGRYKETRRRHEKTKRRKEG